MHVYTHWPVADVDLHRHRVLALARTHNLPVVGSSPTRPTTCDLQWAGYRQVVTSLFQPLMGTEWEHLSRSRRRPRFADQRRRQLGGSQVGLLQRVRVAVVDRLSGVTDLAHSQLLVHARVLH
jgi:hypothetical protein